MTALAQQANLERMERIELSYVTWQATALPLCYTRKRPLLDILKLVRVAGFEPAFPCGPRSQDEWATRLPDTRKIGGEGEIRTLISWVQTNRPAVERHPQTLGCKERIELS